MEPGTLINSLLTQGPRLPALALVGERIYPLRAPQGTPFPYVLYQVISQNGGATMVCELDDEARVQLSLFAKDYASVCAISQACRTELAGYRSGAVTIDFDGQIDQYSDPALCHFRTQDFLLELPAPA